jgi:hypothetical protein
MPSLPSSLVTSGFHAKILYAFSSSPSSTCVTFDHPNIIKEVFVDYEVRLNANSSILLLFPFSQQQIFSSAPYTLTPTV